MRTFVLSTALVVLACSLALAAGQQSPVQQFIPSVAARLQTMQVNEVLRLKVAQQEDFKKAGIKEIKPGDEVEVKKVAADKLEVKHLGTGQTGVMEPPK